MRSPPIPKATAMTHATHPTRRRLPLLAVCLMALTLAPAKPALASESDEAVLLQIMRDWQARRTAMARAHYVIKGTRLIPKGSLTQDMKHLKMEDEETFAELNIEGEFPPRDHVVNVSWDTLIDFQRLRWRTEIIVPPLFDIDYERRTSHKISLFDGKTSYFWYPDMNDEQIQLNVSHKRLSASFSTTPRWLPLYYAHGFVDPTRLRILRGVPLDPKLFSVHATIRQGNKHLVALRANSGDGWWREWWVDLARQSAVTRWTVYFDVSRRSLALDIEYTRSKHGWLLKSWRMQRFDFTDDNNVSQLWNLNVEKLVVDPPVTDDMFTMQPKPGMVVRDRNTDRIYVVAEDGTPGQDFIAYKRSRAVKAVRDTRRSKDRRRWTAILIVGLVITGGSTWWYLARNRGTKR